MKTTNTIASIRKILSALTSRGNYCWLLGHEKGFVHIRHNDLFTITEYYRCKHCSHNMGEV